MWKAERLYKDLDILDDFGASNSSVSGKEKPRYSSI